MSTSTLLARNEGVIDRVLRVTVGLALLGVAVTGNGVWGYLGVIPLLTGMIGSCPIYSVLGINTCTVKR
jgi:hypothetical protein